MTVFPAWRWSICCFFLYRVIHTCLVIPAIIVYSLGNVLLEYPERVLRDFLLGEVITYDLFDQLPNVLIALCQIFGELVHNHMPKLLPLLDGLCLLDRRMQFATFSGALRFGILLDFTHLSYINHSLIPLLENYYHLPIFNQNHNHQSYLTCPLKNPCLLLSV